MSDNGEHILVIDDDRSSRRMLVRALGDAGYECREAGSGTEALTLLHAESPVLLLLDLDMPGVDGAEVLRRLRGDPDATIAQLPAIMLTGHSGEKSEVLCLEAGASDFVTKPINLAVLRARIDTQLRLQSLRQQLQRQNGELEAWRANLERDLAAARLTQQSLIPQKPPMLPGWEVAAVYRPVIQVGGDIYGWLHMPQGGILFWIADATGHGAAAALLTALAKLLFHHGSVEHLHPAKIMEAVNNDFRSIFGARSFMTAMCVALDPATGRGQVAGAGHPPLLLTRAAGVSEMISSSAPPLGLLEKSEFAETEIMLQPGDGFLLYTDGLYGSSPNELDRWTPERLRASLARDAESAQSMLAQIMRRVAPDVGGTLPDDVTAVAVRRTN
ncbi:MAG: SpoIIE family protein phosphatase [Chthoniobacterales bacterium]|nr:SpoIIE family protein phosphatase [Chthoniobacterales bacterium]